MDSKFLISRKPLAEKLVKTLLEKYSYVSLLGKHVTGKTIRVSNFNKSIGDSFESQCGFVVKVFDQGIYKEYSFSDITEDNFSNIIKEVDDLKLSDSLLENKMNLSVLKDEPLVKDFVREKEGKSYSTGELMEELNKIKDKILSCSPLIIQAMAMADQYTVNSFFISKNRNLSQSFSWSTVYAVAVTRKDNNIKDKAGVFVSNNLEKNLIDAYNGVEEVVDIATMLLDSKPIVPGVYDIIVHPSVTGLIAHEAFGHGVEMDMFVKHRAKSRLYINKPVASNLVSMHDGASAAHSAASYFFDDDGVEAHDTLIIDKGILKTGICDVTAANELGVESTGNSRRETSLRKAYTRMTNTFFSPGEDNVEDMIKSIKYGYMLFDSNNGMEDPKNWNIQCVAGYAKEIKDGKFTGNVVAPVIMSGYVPDLLMSISMVSKDLIITGAGHCGKGHKEWVPVSDGGPYLKAKCKLS